MGWRPRRRCVEGGGRGSLRCWGLVLGGERADRDEHLHVQQGGGRVGVKLAGAARRCVYNIGAGLEVPGVEAASSDWLRRAAGEWCGGAGGPAMSRRRRDIGGGLTAQQRKKNAQISQTEEKAKSRGSKQAAMQLKV
jgi:hypothetical protein